MGLHAKGGMSAADRERGRQAGAFLLQPIPLGCHVDLLPAVVEEVAQVVATCAPTSRPLIRNSSSCLRRPLQRLFLDTMPSSNGTAATSVDYMTSPPGCCWCRGRAEACASHVVAADIDLAVSYRTLV